MKILSSSPNRNTFQRNKAEEKLSNGLISLEEFEQILNIYKQDRQSKEMRESDLEWQKNNLEYDLRSTTWIIDKVRASDVYAQNLYAALCNNEFIKVDMANTPDNLVKILKEDIKHWRCSWRYAGGIVADMRQEGDYIDWYCSGIRDLKSPNNGYVSESIIVDQIRHDLRQIGWIPVNEDDS